MKGKPENFLIVFWLLIIQRLKLHKLFSSQNFGIYSLMYNDQLFAHIGSPTAPWIHTIPVYSATYHVIGEMLPWRVTLFCVLKDQRFGLTSVKMDFDFDLFLLYRQKPLL